MRVIVAGGGIVGLTTGIAFKAIGWDVLVCEQASEIRAAGAAIGPLAERARRVRGTGCGRCHPCDRHPR